MMKNNFVQDPEVVRKIRSYIHSHETEIIQDLKNLAAIPSLRAEAEPGMPFGSACARAVNAAADLFERSGYSIDRRTERGYALASPTSVSAFPIIRTGFYVWR